MKLKRPPKQRRACVPVCVRVLNESCLCAIKYRISQNTLEERKVYNILNTGSKELSLLVQKNNVEVSYFFIKVIVIIGSSREGSPSGNTSNKGKNNIENHSVKMENSKHALSVCISEISVGKLISKVLAQMLCS